MAITHTIALKWVSSTYLYIASNMYEYLDIDEYQLAIYNIYET